MKINTLLILYVLGLINKYNNECQIRKLFAIELKFNRAKTHILKSGIAYQDQTTKITANQKT